MQRSAISRLTIGLLGLGLLGLLGCASPVRDTASAMPEPVTTALIYRGTVFDRDHATTEPSFVYERTVGSDGTNRVSTHVTRDRAGLEIVRQAATHDADYRLLAFAEDHAQLGYRRRAVHGSNGEWQLDRGARTTRVRDPGVPVVVGPTLFGFVQAHWDAIVRAKAFPVGFLSLERGAIYRFELRLVSDDGNTTVIGMRAEGLLVRASVPDMRLTFDTRRRTIVRYEGRVPPRRAAGHRLRPMDARVEYEWIAASYR